MHTKGSGLGFSALKQASGPADRCRAVVFDLDDTLVKTVEAKWRHHQAVAREFYGIELSTDDLQKHWGMPFDAMISVLYQYRDSLEGMRRANLSMDAQFPKERMPHAADCVTALVKMGLPVGVVTATNHAAAVGELTDMGFPVDQLFIVQGADDTSFHKPDGRVFGPSLAVLAEAGVAPRQAWYVGDSLLDMAAAHDAGMGFLAVCTGVVAKGEFRDAGAAVIDDLRGLTAALGLRPSDQPG